MSEVVDYTLKSDAVICLFDPKNKNNKVGLANKQFEAMACGRPIICSKGVYSGEVTEKLNCGVVTDFSEEGIVEAVTKLRDEPELCETLGKNALNAAVTEYSWDKQEKDLIKIYEEKI